MGTRLGVLGLAVVLSACSATGSGGSSASGGSSSSSGALSLGCDTSDPTDCICTRTNDPGKVTPNATCSPTSVGAGVCCADPGYPNDQFTLCQCVSWGCITTASSCECGSSMGSAGSCTGGFPHCCVPTSELSNPQSCHCSNLACASDETEVDHCGRDMAGCVLATQMRIDRCTL